MADNTKNEVATITPEEWVNKIILDAAHSRASDIHIDPFESEFQIRFRIDGVLAIASR